VDDSLRHHCRLINRRIGEGKVIPFLGAGANLCERPAGADWRSGNYLPSGAELADYLAESYEYPEHESRDLVRVSQYVDLEMGGEAALYDELHPLFTGDYQPNKLHRFLAERPAHHRAKGLSTACQLIVTTNYDDALERAFMAAEEPFDLVYYAAEPDEPGRFVHVRPDGTRRPIPRHTDYREFSLDERTVILKIHGGVDRGDEVADSYVITEDNYIDYLAHGNLSKLIPAYLMARMRTSHFLFLGYGMRDWNLRVILHHVWSQQVRRFGSWAIQVEPDPIDEKFWQRHRVEIVAARLEDWVDAMREEEQ
jgi:hypothetical protein